MRKAVFKHASSRFTVALAAPSRIRESTYSSNRSVVTFWAVCFECKGDSVGLWDEVAVRALKSLEFSVRRKAGAKARGPLSAVTQNVPFVNT
jgi:hypothetical protein